MSFYYKNNELYVEEIPVSQIVKKVGTPAYIYSHQHFKNSYTSFVEAFGDDKPLVCYSMKCNSNLALLALVAKWGGGVDIVSGGELHRALKAGIYPKKIVYSGIGKTAKEIKEALGSNILMFNVESEAELQLISEVATALKKKAPIALRVNPDIDPKTHPYISTGMKKSKFGIEIEKAFKIYQKASKMPGIEVLGLDCHIGSQLTQVKPFVDALKRLKQLLNQLKKAKITISYLDLGGGLGIQYHEEKPPSPKEYAFALKEELKDFDLKLIFEPGRFMMGNAGILVTEVLYTKMGTTKEFVVVDAAMNDLIRPALYDSYHEIAPIFKKRGVKKKVDIVGPVCESGDFFAKDRMFPSVKRGDLVSIFSAGAYGFVMSSNYNTRTRPVEILVKGKKFEVVRKRESYEDLLALETIPSSFFKE